MSVRLRERVWSEVSACGTEEAKRGSEIQMRQGGFNSRQAAGRLYSGSISVPAPNIVGVTRRLSA